MFSIAPPLSEQCPDEFHRAAVTYELAFRPGTFAVRVHEVRFATGRETWYGGRVLWDHLCTNAADADRIGAHFVATGQLPDPPADAASAAGSSSVQAGAT
jgi:hypothetical protein